MRNLTRLLFAIAITASLAAGTETRTWTQDDYADFAKGNAMRLALSSDGRLTLAPEFQEIFDSGSVYLWDLVVDSKGRIYAGGGGPGGPGARVYEISPDGKGKTLAQFDALEVHALALDKQGQLYAATSPDGKIYKVSASGKSEVFFDPHAKYIWALAFDSKGALYAATGDRGEIFRIAPDGKGRVFYKTEERHARALAIDAADNLIVGTEPGGLIVRVAPSGEGFVLYQAPKREITAVAVSKDGNIYAAGTGARESTLAPPLLSLPAAKEPSPAPANPLETPAKESASRAPAPLIAPRSMTAATGGGSEVYRIDPEGFPRKIWSHGQAIVYAIAFDGEGLPLVGTGNKGTVYRLDSALVYTELPGAPPTQVTAIATAPGGNIYAVTGNVGKVYRIGPSLEKDGTFESDVFDAGLFSRWGRLWFRGQYNGGKLAFQTRSGNLDRPDKDWSAWSEPIASPDGGRIASPPARFLQWKLLVTAPATGASPEVGEVDAAYLPRNVAPRCEQIEITPPNYRFPTPAGLSAAAPASSLNLSPLGKSGRRSLPVVSGGLDAPTTQFAKGWIGARWSAIDDNGDALVYTVEIKGEEESEWKTLKDKVAEKHYSWDSTAFMDGEYRIRVIASDAPSNTAEQALTAEITSEPFLIDNTPPVISGLKASYETSTNGSVKDRLRISWKAVDALSVIRKAEVSINGGEWTLVEPVTSLSDSREEDYKIDLPRPPGAEQTIAVRVTDDYDNQAVAKIVMK